MSTNSDERWRRIEAVFGPPSRRSPRHARPWAPPNAATDDVLRAEVNALLAAHERTGLMDRLADDVAGLTPPDFV
jgi:hypothetical protein